MSRLNDVVDIHCHLLQFGGSHGYLNPRFLKSWQTRSYFLRNGMVGLEEFCSPEGFDTDRINEECNKEYIDLIEDSKLNHAVVLAFDAIYDENGKFDKERTAWYVDNDAVIELAKKSDKILAGACINPLRGDWRDELEKCIEANVALIKWLPNVGGFDPSDKRIIPFYERLAQEEIPMLAHVGYEWAVDKVDDKYADLDKLQLPLDMGLRIIAAHCCGGRPFIDSDEQFQETAKAVEDYPNLYLDVSGMSSVHRKSRLKKAIENESTHERLVFGTDYPVPIHRWAFMKELGLKEAMRLKNKFFDSYMEVQQAMGLNEADFSRGYKLLNPKAFI